MVGRRLKSCQANIHLPLLYEAEGAMHRQLLEAKLREC
jgi:hypothetical protein